MEEASGLVDLHGGYEVFFPSFRSRLFDMCSKLSQGALESRGRLSSEEEMAWHRSRSPFSLLALIKHQYYTTHFCSSSRSLCPLRLFCHASLICGVSEIA